jgi:hypothetical protein
LRAFSAPRRVGVAALSRAIARQQGGLAAAYGLGLYNVLAAGFILWSAAGIGGAALWGAGLIHAAIGAPSSMRRTDRG